jgi:hypothetical protein
LRFFSPPEKPSLTGRLISSRRSRRACLLLTSCEELDRVVLRQAAVLADGVDGGLQEIDVRDARDLDGVLEGQEDALARPHLGRIARRSWPL